MSHDKCTIFEDDAKEYYKNGKLHREDGPAIMWSNGYISYWQNGERHREDGPALILEDGTKQYWKNGELVGEEYPQK